MHTEINNFSKYGAVDWLARMNGWIGAEVPLSCMPRRCYLWYFELFYFSTFYFTFISSIYLSIEMKMKMKIKIKRGVLAWYGLLLFLFFSSIGWVLKEGMGWEGQ